MLSLYTAREADSERLAMLAVSRASAFVDCCGSSGECREEKRMAFLGTKLKLFVTSAERTQYAQELTDQMARVEQTQKIARQLIDRIRCNSQPNKSHRSDDSLLPEEGEDERLRYAATLKEFAAGTSITDPALCSYFKQMAALHESIQKHHEKFLRQVQAFCVKELKKFTEDSYPKIKQTYSDLEKKRDAYDLARHKLKSCKPEEIEEKGQTAKAAQKEFEDQAMAMFEILQKMPEHEMALAKAVYMYTRAEADYTRETNEAVRKFPPPDRKPGSVTKSGKGL